MQRSCPILLIVNCWGLAFAEAIEDPHTLTVKYPHSFLEKTGRSVYETSSFVGIVGDGAAHSGLG
jgi:hypothetical protein